MKRSFVIGIVVFLLVLYFCLRHRNGDNFQAMTPNACVDLMEKNASQDAQDACVAYSNKCDAAYGPWYSPIVGSEVSQLYAKFGITPGAPLTAMQSSQITSELSKGICAPPIKCSSSADCPNPLQCSFNIGFCQ